MINATICFFCTHLLLVFLISISDVRRYNGSFLVAFIITNAICFYDPKFYGLEMFLSNILMFAFFLLVCF